MIRFCYGPPVITGAADNKYVQADLYQLDGAVRTYLLAFILSDLI